MPGRYQFMKSSPCGVSRESLAAWHFRAGAIHRLIPPWERITVIREASPLVDGARAEIEIRKGPIRTTLVALHREVVPGEQFVDTQESGPFGSWRHLHRFTSKDAGSMLEDRIAYDPPFGVLGRIGQKIFHRELERQFEFRHARTREDLRRHAEMDARFGMARMRVGVTGASGLVGRQVCAFLSTGGHEVVRFVRGVARDAPERSWNPRDPERGVDPTSVEDLDAVIHLAGEGIAEGRWTEARKQSIRESRTLGTAAISRAIAAARTKPKVFVSASAIGYYGNRNEEVVDERSAPGTGYLADVVTAWEDATVAAREAGVRTVYARLGVVLSAAGGALAKMRLPFLIGAGGPVGSGRQGMSWISLDDVVAALVFAARNDAMRGAVNLVAPAPLAQREFARVLGRVLHRPAFAPLPAPIVRLLFGEMGERLLLDGAFVRPSVLEREGFRFTHAALDDALRLELGLLRSTHGTVSQGQETTR
ncbi:MAG: TIGR01777 family oxidoreductase [bacterium]